MKGDLYFDKRFSLVPMRWSLLILSCLFFATHQACGDEIVLPDLGATPTKPDNADAQRPFGRQLLYDTRYILTSPTRWDAEDWKWAGLAAGTIVGAGVLFDKRESDEAADREKPLEKLATRLEPFGAQYSLLTIAGFYAGGKLFDSPRAVAVGEDGLAASIIASGIITPFIKWAVGRVRPAETSDPTNFHPFDHSYSFPSGHTTQAFAVASVISAHYDSLAISVPAYGIATLVGYARHQHNAHWTSDIVAGAVIGTTVGLTVVKLNEENRGNRIAIVPTENGPMVALVVPFR